MADFLRLLLSDLASVDLPTALGRLAIGLLALTVAWAVLVAALASWRPTARWARAITPRALRAAALTAVSGSLAISPAQATSRLDGLPLPQRATTLHVPSSSIGLTNRHLVKPGESLWGIASERLGAGVALEAIARESRGWYVRNRGTIGRDPDLILPGQVLVAPRPEDAR